jgi:hypothetical protein
MLCLPLVSYGVRSSLTAWNDGGTMGANQAASTIASTASYTSFLSQLNFLERIIMG